MTRFARAKGSKSSNERLPNEATPWNVMKQQLVENLSKPQEVSERIKSVKELLEEKQGTLDIKNGDTNWAEFEHMPETNNKVSTVKKNKAKQKAQKHMSQDNQDVSLNKNNKNNAEINKKSLKRNIHEVGDSVPKRKTKKHKQNKNETDNQKEVDQIDSKFNETDTKADKLNKKKKKNKDTTIETFTEDSTEKNNIPQPKDDPASNVQHPKNRFQAVLSKRQKRNMKMRKKTGFENDSTENNQPNRFNNKFQPQSNFQNGPQKFNRNQFENNIKKRKPPKIRDDKEHKRRKPDVGSIKLMINGVEVEIVKFYGFPVKKEDAERLQELRQKMIMKGIPQKEIDAAMKLERRKAEKALARIRRCVCFHCRKSGHNLSDCPELGKEEAATGICFKCGSTEHTHFECKVSKPTEFRYATCFICREQGHIAKQCPDNPKGVYPQGGCCKICGDVTHLKKDCPDLITKKEESAVTVNTIASGNIESLEGEKQTPHEKDDIKSKKIVKF